MYRNQTKSGFRQQVLIMFHGTPLTNVESILDNGFRASRDGMLGPGIYASSDFGKAAAFGPCVFKILVYVGRVCKVDAQGHPLQKAWQTKHDSAWVPQGCGMTARQVRRKIISSRWLFTRVIITLGELHKERPSDPHPWHLSRIQPASSQGPSQGQGPIERVSTRTCTFYVRVY